MAIRCKLQCRVVLVVAAIGIAQVLFSLLVHEFFVQPGYMEAERREAVESSRQAHRLLDDLRGRLNALVVDYAGWDDTYAFAELPDEHYESENCSPEILERNGLCLFLVLDAEGKAVFRRALDPVSHEVAEYEVSVDSLLAWGDGPGWEESEAPRGGVIMSGRGPLLVAAMPITDTSLTAPPRGTLVMGAPLAGELEQRFERLSRYDAHLKPVKPEEVGEARELLAASRPEGCRITFEDESIVASSVVPDLEGLPALFLEVRQPRLASVNAGITLRSMAGVDLTGTVVLLLVLFLLLRHLLLGRVRGLSEAALSILREGDFSRRLPGEGDDEVGLLAREMNRLLGHLVKAQTVLECRLEQRTADIIEREARIEHQAYHDALTGLPNRPRLMEMLMLQLSAPSASEESLALLFMDLDGFKRVNDSLGHSAGDELLRAVAHRLMDETLRENDIVARLGGDEFVVLLRGLSHPSKAGKVAAKILDAMRRSFTVQGQEVHVGASIGIAVSPHDGTDAETLIKHSDMAMYHAKESGRNMACFFDWEMNERVISRIVIEERLRDAVSRGDFLLHYQPRLDARTGRVRGVEALLRWKLPEGILVPPAEFIPLAEETGLILPLGEWVLENACRHIIGLHAAGHADLALSVNISAKQFSDRHFATRMLRILKRTGFPPHLLELEITESVLMRHMSQAARGMRLLAGRGVRFSLDDFGTGYSSLAYLRRMPIHCLKVDRSFVGEVCTDASSRAIVLSVCAMARSLGLSVVAEGVETRAQWEFLSQVAGCDELQGFLFARPLCSERLEAYMRRREGERLVRDQARGPECACAVEEVPDLGQAAACLAQGHAASRVEAG